MVVVKIIPNYGAPTEKIADAEVHFVEGPLAGMRLCGFAIWKKRGGADGHALTFPARTYSVAGERRSFALLRPALPGADVAIRSFILKAYEEFEEATRE